MTQPRLFELPDSSERRLSHTGSLPSGLVVVPHFLSQTEEQECVGAIDAPEGDPWIEELRRRVKHFGYRYSYTSRGLTVDDRLGDLPTWAQAIGERLVENGYFFAPPEQVIVNEYLPGQGIAPHIDRESCFGPIVASISLCSDVVMDFISDVDDSISGHVLLPARSAMILSGDARHSWRHGIAPRKRDKLGGATVIRARRLSLTFRTVNM